MLRTFWGTGMWFLVLQGAQNNVLYALHFSKQAIVLGTLTVRVAGFFLQELQADGLGQPRHQMLLNHTVCVCA